MDPRDLWTERLLTDAGIAAGMRVVDLGCGRGDVSLMLARLVGDSGRVLGIDRDPGPLAVARQRANDLGVVQVEFVETDLRTVLADRGPFDAVVGRRVLMYQPDAGAALRHLVEILRPGGVIVFQEHDATVPPLSRAPLPLHVQVRQWIWRTVEREGANLHMGFDLPQLLEAAGLRVEHVRAEAVVQTATIGYPTAMIVRAMLPRIVQHGVASEAEIDIETLAVRLDAERLTAQTTYVSELVFGVSARKPV